MKNIYKVTDEEQEVMDRVNWAYDYIEEIVGIARNAPLDMAVVKIAGYIKHLNNRIEELEPANKAKKEP